MAIADAGGVAPLVDLCAKSEPSGQEEAAAALRSLACDYQNRNTIAERGGIGALVRAVASDRSTDDCKKHAASALRNLATRHASNQSEIAAAGGIEALVSVVKTGTLASKRHAIEALATRRPGPTGDTYVRRRAAFGSARVAKRRAERASESRERARKKDPKVLPTASKRASRSSPRGARLVAWHVPPRGTTRTRGGSGWRRTKRIGRASPTRAPSSP